MSVDFKPDTSLFSSKPAKTGDWSEAAIRVLRERYLAVKPDGTQETPEEMALRVATAIAKADLEYGATDSKAAKTCERFYDLIITQKFLPNSPTLMNAGLDNDLQYSACYVLPVEDSVDGIFDSVKNAALIHKSGGGTGFAFSRLRPRGSRVNTTGGIASGPVSFMRVFDGATEAIKQGGRRRGANMGVLRVDHPDIEEFITCKLDGGVTNFNISVAITTAFMTALYAGSDYDLLAQKGWVAPDGSRYKGGEVIGQKNTRKVFDKIVDAAWRSGDPGLIFIDRVNDGPSNPVPEIELIEATNPCVTGDTLISTENGLIEARSLYYQGQPVRVAIDGRRDDSLYRESGPVFSTGHKMVYRLQTKEGYSLRLTKDHRVMTERGWVKASNLVKGDKIHISNRKGGFGSNGDRDTGMALGWLVGDGYISDDRAILLFYGHKKELAPMFLESVSAIVDGTQLVNRDYPVSIQDVPSRDVNSIGSVRLGRIAAEYGITRSDKHAVSKKILAGTEAMQRGYLQALFSADGTVLDVERKTFEVRLSQSSVELLEQVQILLLNFGIASRIYKYRRPAGYRLLPSSDRTPKEYWCKADHELVISKTNLVTFHKEIGFLDTNKQNKLVDGLGKKSRGPYRETFLVRFDQLIEDGYEMVYDLTEPVTSSFIANGIVVHNCGESPLAPNDACNLGSINLAKFINEQGTAFDWEALTVAIETAVHFLDNVITVNPYPLPEIDEEVKANRRIGLGVMGWADSLFVLGIPYNSDQALKLAGKVMEFIKIEGRKASAQLTNKRGWFPNWEQSIYKDRYPLRNSTITTIAPTGSISIIAGTSSGIEPIFALAYRHIVKQPEGGQRVLTFINPIFERVAKARGFWSEALKAKILETGSCQGLPEVPKDVQSVFVTAQGIAPEWHVKMQAAFQKHTDNGVSKTINLPNSATRKDIEAAYLLAYESGCLGTTVFRDGCKGEGEQVLNVGVKPSEVVKSDLSPKGRPYATPGKTYRKKTPVGTAYITINGDAPNPFEVFINVGKAGSDVAADAEGLGRLISLILRLPSPLSSYERAKDIVSQLRGIGSGRAQGFGPNRVMSLADAIAQAMGDHISLGNEALPGLPEIEEVNKGGDLCPECGQATFVFEEGCKKCYGCGYSEC